MWIAIQNAKCNNDHDISTKDGHYESYEYEYIFIAFFFAIAFHIWWRNINKQRTSVHTSMHTSTIHQFVGEKKTQKQILAFRNATEILYLSDGREVS